MGIKKLDRLEVCKRFRKVHGDKYYYGLFDYRNYGTKSTIICSLHGLFEMCANCHIRGQGCPICGNIRTSMFQKTPKNGKSFKDKYPDKIHEWSKLNVDGPELFNAHTRRLVWRECYQCKFNWQTNLLNWSRGSGCPICNLSIGEKLVYNVLTEVQCHFVPQYRGEGCTNKQQLFYDFAVFDRSANLSVLIEFNGAQHYISSFGDKSLKRVQHCDKIKADWANSRGIPLRIINYKEKDIRARVIEILNEFGVYKQKKTA